MQVDPPTIPSTSGYHTITMTGAVDNRDQNVETNAIINVHTGRSTETSTKQQLAIWAIENHISQSAVNKLLAILKPRIPELPNDGRTLLRTPRPGFFKFEDVPPGKYVHFGVKSGILHTLKRHGVSVLNMDLQLKLNIDGLPLSKSSTVQFWLILVSIINVEFNEPIIVGVYCGKKKPESCNLFLQYFVKEMKLLKETGISEGDIKATIAVSIIICDAPAKALILNVKGHNAYFGCNKCHVEGSFIKNRMTYQCVDAKLRTDQEFENKVDEDYHKGDTILKELHIGLVTQVGLDYMHLVCIGVLKRVLKFYVYGPFLMYALNRPN
ncbi:hypothetical protein PPYR_13381 [Photinus pyralis]|uniref:Uncharacterized protein n=2 Tax=Photinus pyralis TaxID=7054 RepID=A0A5N4A8V7_PHOPY|nr:hypothetical protein PPYR_13381 [Photinus pyralis]